MLYLAMPLGSMHGWGVCSRYLSRELARRTPLTLVSEGLSPKVATDPLDYHFLRQVVRERRDFLADPPAEPPAAVLQAMMNDSLLPWEPRLKGRRTLGYVFFEQTSYTPQQIENARRNFDLVIGGSSWCSDILRQHGLTTVETVLQGVDRAVFNPEANQKSLFHDQFVIFSGGKLELRKGQDLVIRAVKVLQERHPDVFLLAAWHNQWRDYAKTMASSPYVRFRLGKDPLDTVLQMLSDNGIDLKRVLALPPLPHHQMAQVYKNSDLGIFPNRCEGGTNLVLMEYLACGKPALVSYSSGHRDVVNRENAIVLKKMKPMVLKEGDRILAVWDDPDLDELVDKLEWAYQNPSALEAIGRAAGRSMEEFTWSRSAENFYQLLNA